MHYTTPSKTRKTIKICPNTGNLKQNFQNNFGPEIFKNVSTQCTASTHSSKRKRNVNHQTKEQNAIDIKRDEIFRRTAGFTLFDHKN